jgi:hypothetical protein
MDEGTRELETRNPERESDRLEHEVDVSRARLGDLVVELERRGRKLRTPAIAIAAGIVTLSIGGAVAWRQYHHRRRSRVRLLQDMWARAARHPERVAAEKPNVALKILAAAGSAAATMGTRALMKKWMRA